METEKQNIIRLEFGDVREKKIKTPNDFASHMIEHIAWRLGTKIELSWDNENWQELGKKLGEEIKKFKPVKRQASALGMIDDGSAEVVIDLDNNGFEITSSKAVDLEWFLAQRCEQFVSAGASLTDLLTGLAKGLEGKIEVKVANLEDQHHTWEGIYRAIGIALGKIFTPVELARSVNERLMVDDEMEENCSQGDISVLKSSVNSAEVRRGTAETGVTVGIDFNDKKDNQWSINVSESIRGAVTGIEALFKLLTNEVSMRLSVNFEAKVLSSSHVVFEDIGLVLGRALKEILVKRMMKYGINGAGSNLQTLSDTQTKSVVVGISVEGRKFWRFIPFDGSQEKLKRQFLVGQTVMGNMRSEYLDDFIDGLSGGLGASVMVHLRDYSDPDKAWKEIFVGLGQAMKEVFAVNPYRQGVPAGVKATLA